MYTLMLTTTDGKVCHPLADGTTKKCVSVGRHLKILFNELQSFLNSIILLIDLDRQLSTLFFVIHRVIQVIQHEMLWRNF